MAYDPEHGIVYLAAGAEQPEGHYSLQADRIDEVRLEELRAKESFAVVASEPATAVYEVPTGPDAKIWIYYSSAPVAASLPVFEILAEKPRPEIADAVAGHIVLIGTSAIGLRDLVSTPLAAGMPGVMVHAQIIDQIFASVPTP